MNESDRLKRPTPTIRHDDLCSSSTVDDSVDDTAAPIALEASAQHTVATTQPHEVSAEASNLLQRLVTPPTALLATKLTVPPARPNGIARPRLTHRLHAGMGGALTVLVAPAGWGKTTLLSAWCAERRATGGRPSAWVSLDPRDNDPRRFWRYLVEALDHLAPGSTAEAQALLAAADAPSVEILLAPVLNALRDVPDDRVLVLDDYHVIERSAIHADLSFLIEHAPPHLHLVIASRCDLPLTLSRMRAQGLLTELHTADLRFTHEETIHFLRAVMRVDLAPEHVSTLETRTEGWIAGLQLAALSLQSGQDGVAFVQRFCGCHRFVLDYLSEEVLARQPPDVLQFLLRTSILERLSGPLCDAVTEQAGGAAMLERLDRSNLFVVPLDDERRSYRYHHLFAEALQRHLMRAEPTRIATLHLRASRWYAEHGAFQEAVEHALAAGDPVGAAAVIEQAWSLFCGQSDLHPTLRNWIDTIPERTIRSRPLLCLLQAVLLANHRDFTGAERWIHLAEQALAQADTASSEDMNRPIRGMVAALRASFAGVQGQIDEAIRAAEAALRDLPPENAAFRGTAVLSLGYAAVDRGDLPRAVHAFAESMALSRAASSELQFVAAAIHLSFVHRAMGNLSFALQTCEEALAWVVAHRHGSSHLMGFLYVSLADLLRERNALDAALRSARDGVTFCVRWPDPTMQALSLLVLARVQMARGEFADAADTLALAQRHTEVERANSLTGDTDGGCDAEGGTSLASLLCAVTAQVQLAQGMAVSGWPSDQRCFPSFEWSCSPHGYRSVFQVYIAEHAFIAPIQALLARAQQSDDAEALRQVMAHVDELRQQAHTLGLRWLQIKAGVLAALGYQALGARSQALAMLWQALAQAQAERYVRVFADEGAPLVALLDQVADHCNTGHETASLLDPNFISLVRTAVTTFAAAANRRPMSQSPGNLPDQDDPKVLLTAREDEVLQLLAAGCRNEDIALALVVAMGTVKAHVQHIYRKLDAHSRTHALARARELQLLLSYEPTTSRPRRPGARRRLTDGRR
jgi:LuxR family transcriptional regulator, maltose regulon positive regulatory protein